MSTFDVTLHDLPARIAKDMKSRQRRVVGAVRKAAKAGVPIVEGNVPVAFGSLQESIHSKRTDGGAQIIADAPHAAAVENGSRPHRPPVAPLIAWAELKSFEDPASAGWAIAAKIAKEGTKPNAYMYRSLPGIVGAVDEQVRAALPDAEAADDDGGDSGAAPRDAVRWSDEEFALASRLRASGMKSGQIAMHLRRSGAAVAAKLRRGHRF